MARLGVPFTLTQKPPPFFRGLRRAGRCFWPSAIVGLMHLPFRRFAGPARVAAQILCSCAAEQAEFKPHMK